METKMIKMYFHKPLNSSWEDLGKRLRDLQWEQHKTLNFGMTQFWLWQGEREAIKQATGKYPTNKELSHPAYDNSRPVKIFIKKNYPNIPSGTVSSLSMFLKSRWSSDCKDVYYRGDKSLSTFKKTFPILCSNAQYKLTHDKDIGYILTTTLASKNFEGVSRFEISLSDIRLPKGQTDILDRIISKQYKGGELKIAYDKRKKKWYANIAYSFEPEKTMVDPNIICGIDLGVAVPFYAAISNSYERLCPHDGMEIFNFRKQIDKRRRMMQRQLKFSKRSGHGRVAALKPLQKIQNKINNFRDAKYHLYTKRIIEFCIKNQAGTIQLEDLSSLIDKKQEDSFLKNWSIHSFYEKLKYKAKEAGIKIQKVDPKYTSQRCSKCGFISKENRRDQSNFLCINCGYKANADYNAAKNLSIDKIDEIITHDIEKFKKAA